jgi:hypothetical protein
LKRLALGPGDILDTEDSGDDVQLRFRYQHAFAAIQCLKLLGPSAELTAVYCENHEDVLLRLRTGRYIGVQVKTRDFKRGPFKATDTAIMKSLARFAGLEEKFPEQFEGYRIVTNHGFWCEADDGHNLKFIVEQLKTRGDLKGLPKNNSVRAYVLSICVKHGCKQMHVAEALCKVDLVGYGSDLEQSYDDLLGIAATTGDLGERSFSTVRRIADNLVFYVYEASSLKRGGTIASLYDMMRDFDKHREDLVLAGKTLTAETIQNVIRDSLEETAHNLLVSARLLPEELIPSGYDILTEKLERGGLQAARIGKIKDYKASMETLYLRWKYKHSVEEANQRLVHLKTLVEDDCIEARISAGKGEAIASTMYEMLRQRLNSRISKSAHPTFGATEEHLLGAAGILTEECRVWWSDPFQLRSRSR